MTTIFHNPRCSKSRQTLALLEDQGITPQVREYLKEPLSKEEIETLLAELNIAPSALIRSKEKLIKEQGIDLASLSDTETVQLMTEHPILIERPIVSHQGNAAIGRPPEQVLGLFS